MNDRRPAAVPGIVREPAAIRRALPGHHPSQADRRGQEWPRTSGNSSDGLAYGRLLAASDTTVDAFLRQTRRDPDRHPRGDVRCRDGAGESARPRGPRVGIVTNAGGLGIQFADACEAGGLEVPPLSTGRSPGSDRSFPLRRVWQSGRHGGVGRRRGVRGGDRDGRGRPSIDALIVIYIPPLELDAPGVARHLAMRSARSTDDPGLDVLHVGARDPGRSSVRR